MNYVEPEKSPFPRSSLFTALRSLPAPTAPLFAETNANVRSDVLLKAELSRAKREAIHSHNAYVFINAAYEVAVAEIAELHARVAELEGKPPSSRSVGDVLAAALRAPSLPDGYAR